MSNMPKDPAMLLSYINTQLRDYYSSLEDCCHGLGVKPQEIETKLASVDYHYDLLRNQFI